MDVAQEEHELGSEEAHRSSASDPERARPRPSELTAWGRWAWRRLTSMRTAMVLLVLLALTAVPGSVLPQRGVASDPAAVANFYRERADLAPWLDRLSLFNVYSAPWFAAVYVLLLVSMTGCVVPRCAQLWRELRSAPPQGPRHLSLKTGHRREGVAYLAEALAAAQLRTRLLGMGSQGDVGVHHVGLYAAHLRALSTVGLLAIAGFLAFLFNCFGVNLWIPGLHSYAGV